MRAAPSWYVISLRPRGEHAGLRRAAARHGAGLIALSPWRLRLLDDADTRAALRGALAAARVVFTSPVAVRAAHALQPLRSRPGQHWCAVGAGTAAALHRVGIAKVQVPTRMDSEGLLALPALQQIDGGEVGLVTAPGGRGTIAPALQARGARVVRADVYVREPVTLPVQALRRLRETRAQFALALSSGEALQYTLAAAPPDIAAVLRNACVAAASERLATLARTLGFSDVHVAGSPRPRDLVATAAHCRPDTAPPRTSGSMEP